MQSLGAVTIAQLKAQVQVPKYKFEIYYGGAWIDLTSLGSANYLKDFSLSLGGAKMTPDPVAGTWTATINNKNGMFYPANTDSAYYDYFTTGRKVRLSIGGTFGGADVYWQRLIGVMDSPQFSAVINGDISLKGMDFMQYLADFKLRKPNNYWGDDTTISTLDPIEVLLAEIYAENDALEIGAGEANTVASWTPSAGITISSFADVGGGSTYVMKAILASGATPTVDIYSTAGAFQWECPAGVLSVDAESWGAGGGGAGMDLGALAGGGAGGGAYSKKLSIAVTPGQLYSVIVGAAGSAGSGGAGATPTVETFLASGGGNWLCPAGVYYIDVELWGGGGGGGSSDTYWKSGGGGGGGGYSKKRIYVTPGTSYPYLIGALGEKGLGGSGSSGGAGGDSFFIDVVTALAKGGSGGQSAAAGMAGGAGGILGVGDTRYVGGNGGNGINAPEDGACGGGGGSSAGNASNGNNGQNGYISVDYYDTAAGGAAPAGGGIGGESGYAQHNGQAPISGNGGGGGGAGNKIGTEKPNGGDGTCGKMVLTYSISNASDGTDGGDSSFVDLITLLAKGGSKGLKSGVGGNGGALASGVGDIKYSGGNGGSGYQGAGGGAGGGSSAGTAINGNNGGDGAVAAGGTAGTAPAGGSIGGVGGNPDSAGNTPASGAGGGGGGAGCNTTAVRAGAVGKPGKVILSYNLPGTGSSATIEDTNIGSIVAGTQYKCVFKYKRESGDGTATLGVYVGAVRQGESSSMSTAAWTTETFYFTAADSGTAKGKFTVSDSGAGSEFRFDQMSLKAVSSLGILPRYSLPALCTGVYYATLDGEPIWNGIDQVGLIGWYYDSVHNEFCFTPSSQVIAGTNNLVVYYHTAQIPVYVVADILVDVGLYATQLAALLAMTYTETGESIPRVWFEAGTSALNAIQKLCEKCNFRFYFKYDGSPVFIPAPAIKGSGHEDAAFEQNHISSPDYYEDSSELFNVIAVEGEKIAQPIGLDQTMQSNYKGSDSDPTSITENGDRTKSISNHLFQSDAVCLSMATTLLAAYKDKKKYFSCVAPFNAIPLELSDTIRAQVRLAPGNGAKWGSFKWSDGTHWGSNGTVIVHRGIIRNIKISRSAVNYICELAT